MLRCIQLSLFEELGDKVEDLFNAIGLKTQGKDVTKMTSAGINNAYKETLGYPTTASLETMRYVVGIQIPHDSLVFNKIIRSWCMALIKKKVKSQREAFICVILAEPQIKGSIPHLILQNSNNTAVIARIVGIGFLRSSCALIAAVSPEEMGILRCTQ